MYKTLVDKIYYLRWGVPADDLYFRVGSLPSITLGNGSLVNGYSNIMDYPRVRRTGINFNYNFQNFKFQFVHSDLKEAREPGLFAIGGSFEYVKNVDFSFSLVIDPNQRKGLLDSDRDGYPDFVEPDYANDPDYHHENQFLIEELQGSNYCGYDSESDSFLDGTCENLFNDLSNLFVILMDINFVYHLAYNKSYLFYHEYPNCQKNF